MPANPHYRPDWAERLRQREDSVAKWRNVCDTIAAQDGFGSLRHRAAMAQQEDALQQAKEAGWAKFETIAAYAAWRFASLPENAGDAALVPDFDAFESIEAVDAAYARARERRREPAVLDEVSLPVRQPAGLAAFVDEAAVIVSPRRFAAAELAPHDGSAPDAILDCVVSLHQLAGEAHFCIAHRWGDLSPKSSDQFRNIATRLAQQALEYLHPGAAVLFGKAGHASPEHRDLIRQVNASARTFHFYRHMLPRRDLKEQFCRVDMEWQGMRFIDPDWSAAIYASLPAVLRAASERRGESSDPSQAAWHGAQIMYDP